MDAPSATINLVYKVPTTSLLLYYQTHFVFLHYWYNAMVVAHGAGLSFEQRCVPLTSFIYLFICFDLGRKITLQKEIVQGISIILPAYNSCYQIRRMLRQILDYPFFCLLGCIWLCNGTLELETETLSTNSLFY